MSPEQVETFLTVVGYGAINRAAENMFLSQSTVSNRIALLEEELGTPLLYRQRGQRNLELTPYGRAFLPLANQWIALWKDTRNLKLLSNIQTINIASVDAVNNFTFVPLFSRHIERYPNIKLGIQIHHSDEIHTLVANHTVDFGFVFSQVRHPDIISRPIYRELMYLICHQDSPYHDDIAPNELDPTQEVYLNWGPDYQNWHDQQFGIDSYHLIMVDTGSMLQHYLNVPDRWAIAPMSVVQEFKHHSHLVSYRLKTPPPSRICYQLTHRYPTSAHADALAIFEDELQEYICSSHDICRFEPWMLNDAPRKDTDDLSESLSQGV